jgi:hypothetical protein
MFRCNLDIKWKQYEWSLEKNRDRYITAPLFPCADAKIEVCAGGWQE